MPSRDPYVSVHMITFNHERYIAQAIESVLAQNAPFPIELVIGEDASTDGTRAIVEEYCRRYPGTVRACLRERNLGFRRNFIDTLRACRGRYVALLEGDDYWLSPDKLARQAEVLDVNPDVALCSARARVVYEGGDREPWEYPIWQRTRFTAEDL